MKTSSLFRAMEFKQRSRWSNVWPNMHYGAMFLRYTIGRRFPLSGVNWVTKDSNRLENFKERYQSVLDDIDIERTQKELNISLEDIRWNDHRRIYWICSFCGSSYQKSVGVRTRYHAGCNACKKSFPSELLNEQSLFPNHIFSLRYSESHQSSSSDLAYFQQSEVLATTSEFNANTDLTSSNVSTHCFSSENSILFQNLAICYNPPEFNKVVYPRIQCAQFDHLSSSHRFAFSKLTSPKPDLNEPEWNRLSIEELIRTPAKNTTCRHHSNSRSSNQLLSSFRSWYDSTLPYIFSFPLVDVRPTRACPSKDQRESDSCLKREKNLVNTSKKSVVAAEDISLNSALSSVARSSIAPPTHISSNLEYQLPLCQLETKETIPTLKEGFPLIAATLSSENGQQKQNIETLSSASKFQAEWICSQCGKTYKSSIRSRTGVEFSLNHSMKLVSNPNLSISSPSALYPSITSWTKYCHNCIWAKNMLPLAKVIQKKGYWLGLDDSVTENKTNQNDYFSSSYQNSTHGGRTFLRNQRKKCLVQ